MQSGPDSGDMILRAPQALLKQKLQVNMLNIALKPVLNSETRVQWVDIYIYPHSFTQASPDSASPES